ncbi:MAG TPA: hypothetical protein VEL31_09775 [Ktedonobacteraceae bacterium]|nr:hypothetical protein [Ktedonobacteraceae bacterium]
MQRYERAIRTNMAGAERDMRSHEDRRGFVIGAVLKLWEVYQAKEIDEGQFDRLIDVLSVFASGEYRQFIQEQVKQYKSGNPPTIIGY